MLQLIAEISFSLIGIAISVLNLFVLIVTLTAVILYTRETAGMRKETVKHNELVIRPFIVLKSRRLSMPEKTELILHNIGNGPALNISIKPIGYTDNSDRQDTISFTPVGFIAAKDKSPIQTDDEHGLYWAIELPIENPYEVQYSDLNKKLYYTAGYMGKHIIHFNDTGEVKD